MSKKVLDRLKAELGQDILETSSFRGDDQAVVDRKNWLKVASFLRDDPRCAMNQFTDLTAADYPEREDVPRFDVLLLVRSLEHGHRVRIKTRVGDGQTLASLAEVWPGTNWAEREIYDMFGIRFDEHPDLRRILMYEEFEGYPLRKDYPIERTQPLMPYRNVPGIEKLAPFGADEGQPWGRIDWGARLEGGDLQVSPSIAEQVGQRKALSSGTSEPAELPTGEE